MKYAIQMGPDAMIYIQSFINIGSGIQKLIVGDIQSHKTHRWYGDCISLLLCFHNKESGIKRIEFLSTLIRLKPNIVVVYASLKGTSILFETFFTQPVTEFRTYAVGGRNVTHS
jgi:hypothetical protein